MNLATASEKELREYKVDGPKDINELNDIIGMLTKREHDYGTCVYAMSIAAVATFNFVAHKLGVTGFQASCADMDMLRRTRNMTGPFMIVKGEDMLYPQYDIPQKVMDALAEWSGWAKEQAQNKLNEHGGHNAIRKWVDNGEELQSYTVAPRVLNHWRELAGLPPEQFEPL